MKILLIFVPALCTGSTSRLSPINALKAIFTRTSSPDSVTHEIKTAETITIPEMTEIMREYGSQFRLPSLECFDAESVVIKTLEVFDPAIFKQYDKFLRQRILSVPKTFEYSPAGMKISLVNYLMAGLAQRAQEEKSRVAQKSDGLTRGQVKLFYEMYKISALLKAEDQSASPPLIEELRHAISIPEDDNFAELALRELLPLVEFLRALSYPDQEIILILNSFRVFSTTDGSRNYLTAYGAIKTAFEEILIMPPKSVSYIRIPAIVDKLVHMLLDSGVTDTLRLGTDPESTNDSEDDDGYTDNEADSGDELGVVSGNANDPRVETGRTTIWLEEAARGGLDSKSHSRHRKTHVEADVKKPENFYDGEEFSTYEGVIIRHAQSIWNRAKAAGKLSFANAMCLSTEMKDAPLSDKGIKESEILRDIVWALPSEVFDWEESALIEASARKRGLEILKGEDSNVAKKTLLVTSNMRRAMSTGVIALKFRNQLESGLETVHIMSSAQELSHWQAADARCITEAQKIPDLGSKLANNVKRFHYDVSHNYGDQNTESEGEHDDGRLERFCSELVSMMKAQGKEIFVLAGHSSWIQAFIQEYQPVKGNKLEDELKKKGVKLGNASVISVKLDVKKITNERGEPDVKCRLRAGETKLVYGSLQRKTKKSK